MADRISVLVKFPPLLLAQIEAAKRPGESRLDAILRLLQEGLHPAVIVRPVAIDPAQFPDGTYAPRPRAGAMAAPVDPLTGEPITGRGPYQKGAKRA